MRSKEKIGVIKNIELCEKSNKIATVDITASINKKKCAILVPTFNPILFGKTLSFLK
jgi:hypothetical protein